MFQINLKFSISYFYIWLDVYETVVTVVPVYGVGTFGC